MPADHDSLDATCVSVPTPLTMMLRRGTHGDKQALDDAIRELTPLLHAQAGCRLGRYSSAELREELLSLTWLTFLEKFESMDLSGTNATRRVKAFLANILVYQSNNLLRREALRTPVVLDSSTSRNSSDPMDDFAATVTDAVARAARSEHSQAVRKALDELDDDDRLVIVMRCIECMPNEDVARQLGEKPNTIAQRYGRALDHLRARLPTSLFQSFAA